MIWTPKHIPEILTALWQHLALCLSSVGIGCIIALVLGIVCARRPKLYAFVLTVTGLIFVIPSLALFTLLIPFLGLGMKPAIVGLSSYTLLILLRNVVTGCAAFRARSSTRPTEWATARGNGSSGSSCRWHCR